MSKLSLKNEYDPTQKTVGESREKSSPFEYKPSVRLQKREQKLRSKLRIKDLYPDRQNIKEVSGKEFKYFILLIVPIAVTAVFMAIQNENLYNRIIKTIVSFWGS
ncbi:MAG: hypothetical protein ACOX2F_09785 [bacterium]